MKIELARVPAEQAQRNDFILFSESAGRFIVTIDPENRKPFEEIFTNHVWATIGTVTETPEFIIEGIEGRTLMQIPVQELKAAWKKPFGDLI
jgi:phosphoribosylformylglycinamidine synthase